MKEGLDSVLHSEAAKIAARYAMPAEEPLAEKEIVALVKKYMRKARGIK